jgi:hypothetical protein
MDRADSAERWIEEKFDFILLTPYYAARGLEGLCMAKETRIHSSWSKSPFEAP